VACECEERPVRDPEGSAWVAPIGDVRVKLPGAGGRPFSVVLSVEDDCPVDDEQCPGLHEIAQRPRRSRACSTMRRTPSSITTLPRRAAYGATTGSWRAGRPPTQSSRSGRYGSRSKKPPTTASSTPFLRHHTSRRSGRGKYTTRARVERLG